MTYSLTHLLTYSLTHFLHDLLAYQPTYPPTYLTHTPYPPTYSYLTHLLCLTYHQVLYAVAAILMFARFTSVMKLTSRVGLLYATQGG